MKGYGTIRKVMDIRWEDRSDVSRQGRFIKPSAKARVRRSQKRSARRENKVLAQE